MSDESMDLTDEGARRLLMAIGEKAMEPYGVEHPTKTLGAWRHEMAALTTQAMFWVAAWRSNTVER